MREGAGADAGGPVRVGRASWRGRSRRRATGTATHGRGARRPLLTSATARAPRVHRSVVLTRHSAFLLGLGVLFGWLRRHGERRAGAGDVKRLAVLPFENLGAADDEYFADGVTDAIRGKLAAIPGLQVIASRSADRVQEERRRTWRRSRASWASTTS